MNALLKKFILALGMALSLSSCEQVFTCQCVVTHINGFRATTYPTKMRVTSKKTGKEACPTLNRKVILPIGGTDTYDCIYR